MEPESFKCPQCEFTHTSLNSLRIHCAKKHKLESIDLRIALFGRPTCECGCGELTPFNTLQLGFVRFVNGHNARVNNGWGHNKKALEKSQAIRREMWKQGEIKAWRKGLSPDDPRNKILIEKMTRTIQADEVGRVRRSKQMSQARLNGTIPTLTGERHSQWKGGTSSISGRCHGSSRLFKEWKYIKLQLANFKCQRCGSEKDLQVHHNDEKMATIIHKMVERFNPDKIDSWDLSTKVVDAVVDYHVENDVSGEVICKTCHKVEHPTFNF